MYKHYLRRFFMNNAKNEGSDASRLALALLKGTAVGIGAAAVLMPILALAAYSSPDPSKLTVYLGYAAFALAAAVSGIATAKFTGGGMLPGAISAAGLSVLVFAVSLLIDGESETSAAVSAAFHFGAVLLGALSAAAAGKRKPKKHAKHSSPKKAQRRRSR